MFGVKCFDTHDKPISHYTQWDINQTLKIVLYGMDDGYMKNAPYVHFANIKSSEALVVPSTLQGDNTIIVDIPNILLQELWPLLVYVYLSDSTDASSQRTIVKIEIPVHKRARPSNYEYVENIDRITAEVIKQEIYDDIMDEVHGGNIAYPYVTFIDESTGKHVNLKVSDEKFGLYVDSTNRQLLDTGDIVNNLMTDSSTKVLSASMGAAIKNMVDVIPNNIDEKIEEHDSSPTSHSDIRDDISSVSSAVDTMQDSIAEIENKIDDVMLDDTISGSGILTTTDTLIDSSPIEMRIKGNTVQNLWVNPSGTSNGVTVTSNADGSVAVSGTCTGDNVWQTTGAIDSLKPDAQYTIAVNNAVSGISGGNSGFYVAFYNAGGSSVGTLIIVGRSGHTEGTFTVPAGTSHFVCGFNAVNGDTVSGTYRVMLNEGSEAEPWCPPGLNSVGQLREDEKNLWVNPSGTQAGITVTANDDGTVTLSGTNTGAVTIQTPVSGLKPNTMYYIHWDENLPIGDFCVGINGGDTFRKARGTFTTGSDVSNLVFAFVITGAQGTATFSGTYKVMLNEGSIAKPWVPPESESCVQVVTAGKNLFDASAGIDTALEYELTVNSDGSFGFTIHQNGWYSFNRKLLPVIHGAKYTISVNKKVCDYGHGFVLDARDYTGAVVNISNVTNVGGSYDSAPAKTWTCPDDVAQLWVALWVDVEETFPLSVSDVKLCVNIGEDSEWTPYAPITTAPIDLQGHTLNALPDGTCDELTIDATGAVTLTKRVGAKTIDAEHPISVDIFTPASGTNLPYVVVPNMFTPFDSIGSGISKTIFSTSWPYTENVKSRGVYRTWNATIFVDERFTDKETAKSIINEAGGTFVAHVPSSTTPLTAVTLPTLPSDKSNIYTTSNVPTAGLTVRYWKKGGELVANLYKLLRNHEA